MNALKIHEQTQKRLQERKRKERRVELFLKVAFVLLGVATLAGAVLYDTFVG